mgnify:CR=1 FL=1
MSEIGEVLAAVLGILQMPLTIHDLTFTFCPELSYQPTKV